ncbi:MAG TPA: amidase [Burkholderiales bacterium]|nr:amidase [Burkholderiales bacterium]
MHRSPYALDFCNAREQFLSGRDTPRAYLERCISTIMAREAEVHAFVTLGLDRARAAADASTERYRAGKPLSAVDGMPIGVKDIMDTADLPTQMGNSIFKGWQPRWDAACVHALRSGGAIVVGKTVTTAFAGGETNETRNPLDTRRTPGGSSSGSAAAVGAGMVPAALGTQTQGSTLRPASFCGAFGFKPTHGALTMQGVHPISLTHDHLGVIAASLEDTWCVASRIALAAGSPGSPGLDGAGFTLPPARRPRRLIVQLTKAWETEVDTATHAAFDGLLERLRKREVELVTRRDDARYAELEDAFFGPFIERSIDINSYEMRWPYEQYVESRGAELEKRQHTRVARAREMTPEYYAELLVEKAAMKEKARVALGEADAVLTLSASGPAPVGHSHTGSRAYLLFATFLQLPAISLPLLQSDGMPVGVQLIGHAHRDGDLCALANWLQGVQER